MYGVFPGSSFGPRDPRRFGRGDIARVSGVNLLSPRPLGRPDTQATGNNNIQQRLLTRAVNRAEHRLTEVYKILRSSLGPGSSVWVKGKKRGQIANRKNIGERAFSDNP